jgi:hypothetical protein
MDVMDLYDPQLFVCGATPVRDSPLKPSAFAAEHRGVCARCAAVEAPPGLDPACYAYGMYRCLTHGWAPPVSVAEITPRYAVSGNYPTVAQFLESTKAEMADMLEHGVIYRAPPGMVGITHPLGVVIKGSDRAKASILAGVPSICNDATLRLASGRLQGLVPLADGSFLDNYGKVKARSTVDATATGVNGAAYSPPFSYPGFSDVAHIMFPNCWLGKCDVSRYFFSYPLAYSVRWLFMVCFLGVSYLFGRVFFGFTAAPMFCSTYSAEFYRWFKARGLHCSMMVDDFICSNPTRMGVERDVGLIISVLTAVGLVINPDKSAFGQELVFLGFLWSSLTMTVRFDAVQARAYRAELLAFKAAVIERRQVSHTTIRHLAGKANWYAEAVSSARLHTRAFWLYLKHGKDLSQLWHDRLLYSIDWWLATTETWGQDKNTGAEYKIFSADTLTRHPEMVLLIQSDASGTDGRGYLWSTLADDVDKEARFCAHRWSTEEGPPPHSFFAELRALQDALTDEEIGIEGKLLLWITDSLSAVHAVNRGRCKDEATFALLESIFDALDSHTCQIVALFVPREENEAADYLSHLATLLNRDSVSGFLSDLDRHAGEAR